MISGLRIGNFKAFSDTQHIPIRPLTLIFGPNSSGKSSLIHSLILAHHGMKKGDLDVHRTEIGGDSVDLGGFKQYIFNRDADRQVDWAIELNTNKFEGRLGEIFKTAKKILIGVTIGLGFDIEVPNDSDLFETTIDEMFNTVEQAKKIGKEVPDFLIQMSEKLKKFRYQSLKLKDIITKKPRINTYQVDADGLPLLKMSIRKGSFLRLDTVNNEHPVFKSLMKAIVETSTTTDKITEEDFAVLDNAISELVSKITVDIPKFFPHAIKQDDQTIYKDANVLLAISKSRRKEDLLSALNMFFPRIVDEIIRGLTEITEKQLNRFRYLGPLRSYPPRHLAFAQYHDPNWLAGGGYAWDEISKKPELKDKINEWLGNPEKLSTNYELIAHHLLTIDDLKEIYSKRVSDIEDAYIADMQSDDFVDEIDDLFGTIYNIPKDLKTIEQNLTEINELVLRDKRTETTVSHRDVGIGISQVLPVLASAYANKDSIIAIEQPEIHLHPALQAELGDVFIESALGESKNTFLIETHSEHIILRLLRRIRETSEGTLEDGICPISPSDIAVVYAQPTPKGAVLKELRVTEEGEFKDNWPEGFFAERAKELF